MRSSHKFIPGDTTSTPQRRQSIDRMSTTSSNKGPSTPGLPDKRRTTSMAKTNSSFGSSFKPPLKTDNSSDDEIEAYEDMYEKIKLDLFLEEREEKKRKEMEQYKTNFLYEYMEKCERTFSAR